MSSKSAEQHVRQVEKVMTSLGKGQVGGLLETDMVNESWVQEMLKSYFPVLKSVPISNSSMIQVESIQEMSNAKSWLRSQQHPMVRRMG